MLIQENEFMIVRHSILNGNTYIPEELVENTLKLQTYTNNRIVVPCFEGDLHQIKETDEIVLTHVNYKPLTQEKFKKYYDSKIASTLNEILDKYSSFKSKNKDQRLILCFEPKLLTSKKTIENTIKKLIEYKVKEAHFDSYYPSKINHVLEANEKYNANFTTSLHLLFKLYALKGTIYEPKEYDYIIPSYPSSIGEINQPHILGAIDSKEKLKKISQNPLTLGAYTRFKEGKGMKGNMIKLFNSVTNTIKLRKVNL